MSVLAVHGPGEDLEDILSPASPDGDEFTAPPGSVVLFVVNRLKRYRGYALRVERGGGTDDMNLSVGPRQSSLAGPFGMAYGTDGIEIPSGDPVTVKITYPDTSGLRVCVVRTPTPGERITYNSPALGRD
jgi:hypothetical protein